MMRTCESAFGEAGEGSLFTMCELVTIRKDEAELSYICVSP